MCSKWKDLAVQLGFWEAILEEFELAPLIDRHTEVWGRTTGHEPG